MANDAEVSQYVNERNANRTTDEPPDDASVIYIAREVWGSDEIEIGNKIDRAEDGAWVSARVWVDYNA